MNKIGAVVVTYFPDECKLTNLLRCLSRESVNIYVIDNTPESSGKSLKFTKISESDELKYELFVNGVNLGIAKAQNIGIELAIENKCDHIIFFDQDSSIPFGIVNKLLNTEKNLLKSGKSVGSVGPLYVDHKSHEYGDAIIYKGPFEKKIKVSPNHVLPVETAHLISSGTIIRTSIIREIGNMREELFIDWVDIEWGLRARAYNYHNYIDPSVVLTHSIGDECLKLGKKTFNKHSDLRNYYNIRNMSYLLFRCAMPWQWRMNTIYKIPRYIYIFVKTAPVGLRIKTLKVLIQAFFDGVMGRVGVAR